jgi:predicted anti-sigma-YlaC factor YlaD
MKDEHIISRLETGPVTGLSEQDLNAIEAHVAGCESCRRAYSVARLADDLVRSRTAEFIEPPPFFQTRVLAAWRERRAAGDAWSFARMWRSAGVLVSSMAATVAVLAALTFALPMATSTGNVDQPLARATAYSAEDVIFDAEGGATVSEGQAVTAILDADAEGR